MCEMCEAKTEIWAEPFPGWFLDRATKDGDILKAGEWCLVMTNYPSFWWSEKPHSDDDSMEWAEAYDKFTNELNTRYLDDVLLLADAAKKAGYNRDADGSLEVWLFSFLGKCLEGKTEPENTAE